MMQITCSITFCCRHSATCLSGESLVTMSQGVCNQSLNQLSELRLLMRAYRWTWWRGGRGSLTRAAPPTPSSLNSYCSCARRCTWWRGRGSLTHAAPTTPSSPASSSDPHQRPSDRPYDRQHRWSWLQPNQIKHSKWPIQMTLIQLSLCTKANCIKLVIMMIQ